jgi:hypothetical protein
MVFSVFFIIQQFHDDVGKIKTTQINFSAYMDASGIKEELVSLVASLSEAYICAGESHQLRIIDLPMNKKGVRSKILQVAKSIASLLSLKYAELT